MGLCEINQGKQSYVNFRIISKCEYRSWPVETFEISDRLKFDMGEDLFIELLNYFLIVKLIMFYFHFKIRLYQYCFVKQYLAFLKTCGTVTLYTLSFFF